MKRLTQYENRWSATDLRVANISLALEHKHLRLVLDVIGKKLEESSTSAQQQLKTVYLVAEYCDCTLWVSDSCTDQTLRPQLMQDTGLVTKLCPNTLPTVQREVHQIDGAPALIGTDTRVNQRELK